jgi:peroxiredoxin
MITFRTNTAFNTLMKVIRISTNAWNRFATKNWVMTHAFRNINLMSDFLLNGLIVRHVSYNKEC